MAGRTALWPKLALFNSYLTDRDHKNEKASGEDAIVLSTTSVDHWVVWNRKFWEMEGRKERCEEKIKDQYKDYEGSWNRPELIVMMFV